MGVPEREARLIIAKMHAKIIKEANNRYFRDLSRPETAGAATVLYEILPCTRTPASGRQCRNSQNA